MCNEKERTINREGRTFTQDEVNNILRRRLTKERAKFLKPIRAEAERLLRVDANLTAREQQLETTKFIQHDIYPPPSKVFDFIGEAYSGKG